MVQAFTICVNLYLGKRRRGMKEEDIDIVSYKSRAGKKDNAGSDRESVVSKI